MMCPTCGISSKEIEGSEYGERIQTNLKVFVVSHTWIHEGSEIKQVFASYKAAKDYVDVQDNTKHDWYDITEWEVR
jgi:hypothetical protein